MKSLASLCLCVASVSLVACRPTNDCGDIRMYDPENDLCVCRPEYTMVGDFCIPNDEVDAGTDAGRDANVDAPAVDGTVAMCTTPAECPDRANATPTCESMACGFDCEEDWGDCDGDATNGCETDLTSTEAHCGMCGNACDAEQLCLERSCDVEPVLDWALTFGEISTEQSYAIDIAADGDVLVAGTYDDRTPVAFGDEALGEGGFFVATFDSTGLLVFALGDGGEGTMFPGGITADEAGNAYVVGNVFAGSFQLGVDTYSSEGGSAAIVSYGPDGAYRWSHLSDGADFELFRDVDTDESGFVVAVGSFAGASTFGEFPARRVTSEGESDAVAVSYSSGGSVRWTERVGGMTNARASAVAFSADGSLVLGGSFTDAITLNGIERTGGFVGGFALGLSTAGIYQFDQVPVSDGVVAVTDLQVGADGSIFLAGFFQDTVNFGGDDLNSVGASLDVFVVKLDREGDHVWSRRFGGTGNLYFEVSLAVTSEAVVLGGTFDGRISLGGDSVLSGADGTDGFLASYDHDGNPRWIRALQGPNEDTIRAIASRDGVLAVTGFYQESIDVGETTTLNSTGFQDVFVARYHVR